MTTETSKLAKITNAFILGTAMVLVGSYSTSCTILPKHKQMWVQQKPSGIDKYDLMDYRK